MDASVLEEAITDWHRLGNPRELPCEEILRLRCYLNSQSLPLFFEKTPNKSVGYLPHHVKTVNYFVVYAHQLRYWEYVDRMLSDILVFGMNDVSLRAEEVLRRPLTPEEIVEVGHTLLVNLSAADLLSMIASIRDDPLDAERIIREHVVAVFVRDQAHPSGTPRASSASVAYV